MSKIGDHIHEIAVLTKAVGYLTTDGEARRNRELIAETLGHAPRFTGTEVSVRGYEASLADTIKHSGLREVRG